MNKNILFTIICLIVGVVLYFFTPIIHYISTLNSRLLLYIILSVFTLLFCIGIFKVVKLPKGSKVNSLRWFLPAVVIVISMLPHVILSQGNYEINGCIIYRYGISEFGVADKWGKMIFPKSNFESLFFSCNVDEGWKLYLVGIKLIGPTENKVHEVREMSLYELNNDHFKPFRLYRITCVKSDTKNASLYLYIKDNVGIPMVGNTDYMSILENSYVIEVVDLELKEGKEPINTEGEQVETPIDSLAELAKHLDEYNDVGSFEFGKTWYEKNRKRGLIDKLGNVVVDCKYDAIYCAGEDIWAYNLNKKYGFCDNEGNILSEAIYDDFTNFKYEYAGVKRNNLYGVINNKGEEFIPCIYEFISLGEKNDGLFRFKKNNRYGFINAHGQVVIDASYPFAEDFSEGFALVHIDTDDHLHCTGYLDTEGNIAFDFKFSYGSSFKDGYAIALINEIRNRHYVILGKNGYENHLPKEYEVPNRNFSDGLLPICKNINGETRYGYIDGNGRLIVDFRYRGAGDFHEGRAKVSYDGKGYGYIDKQGNVIVPFKYSYYSDNYVNGVTRVHDELYNYGVIDINGTEIIPLGQYNDIEEVCEDMIKVIRNEKVGYVNLKGDEVIPCIYEDGDNFSNGLARVKLNGKIGFVDKHGNSTFDKMKQ